MRHVFATIVWFLVAGACWGQGLKPTPPDDYNALPRYAPNVAIQIVVVNEFDAYKKIMVSRSVMESVQGPLPALPPSVDLTPFAPKPGNQSFQDCTAWATAYCCLSTQNARLRGIKSPSDSINLFSPRFVYSQINNGTDNGSFIFNENMNTINSEVGLFQAKGCSSNLLTPYISSSQSNTGWSTTPNANSFVEAANYPLFKHTKCENIDDIRYALVFGIPVVIGAFLEPEFHNYSGSGIYRWGGGKNGRHAMCIIGYDNPMQAFLVQNSWGETWGDQGRFWVGYNEFAKLNTNDRENGWCYEAHAIILNSNTGTQIRSTSNPFASYFFTPDGAVQRVSDKVKIAAVGRFRAVESTGLFLYGLTNDGVVQYYRDNHWVDITSLPFPHGLGGDKAKTMAASGRFLYVITELGDICGRIPSNESSTSVPYWAKANLPGGKTPIDIRFRGGSIYAESSDGLIYERIAGVGWQLCN